MEARIQGGKIQIFQKPKVNLLSIPSSSQLMNLEIQDLRGIEEDT